MDEINSDLMSIQTTLLNSAAFTREYFQQEDICRFCWSKGACKHLYTNKMSVLKNPLICKVLTCLEIDLNRDESALYPRKICEDCFSKIEQFYEFKLFCQDSNRKLAQILNISDDNTYTTAQIDSEAVKLERAEDFNKLDLSSADSFDSFIDNLHHTEFILENDTKLLEDTDTDSLENKCTEVKYLEVEGITESVNDSVKKKLAEEIIPRPTKTSRYKRRKCSTYCNICNEILSDPETFIKHNSVAHGIEQDGKFKCFGCGRLYNNRKARLAHEKEYCKILNDGYKCSLCNKFLPTRGVYEKHMKDHRNNKLVELPETQAESIFKCGKCDKRFEKKALLRKHLMEEHAPTKNYVCETCGRVFTRLDYLKKHNTIHTGHKRYVCPHCGFRTTQKTNLTLHIRKHTQERPYACDLCPLRCISSSNLLAHRRRHLGLNKTYECTICKKTFGYIWSLKDHMEVIHEKSQSNICPHCGAVYARRRCLRRHLSAKHPNDCKEPCKAPKRRQIQRALKPNLSGDKNETGVDKSNLNEKNINIPYSKSNENNTLVKTKDTSDSDFVCHNDNTDLGVKRAGNIVILLQQ